MSSKRTRKKLFEEAVGILILVTGATVSAEEVEKFVGVGRRLFGVRNVRPHYAFLRLGAKVEVVFSTRNLKIFRFLIDSNFSEARQQFLAWRTAWEREAPKYLRSAFELEHLAMDRMIFLASE